MATIDLGKIKQVFRGTYNNSTAYAVDDLVVFTDGTVTSTYICTTASTGNAPSSGGTAHGSWAYVAKGQAVSPTTTQGDIIVRGASADARLAIGAAGKALKVNSSANGLEYGDAGAWTKIAGGSGPNPAGTAINIDNIFSDTYQFYKIFYSFAQDDWIKGRYIKADGSIESGSVYLWTGQYSRQNADDDGDYGSTNASYGVYSYWNGADDCPAYCEISFYHPYSSSKETSDFVNAQMVDGSRVVWQSGMNCNMNAYSVRGIQFFSANGDSLSSTNFKYLVLGAKL